MVTQWGFRNNTSIDDFPIAWDPSEPIGYGGNSLLSSDTENEIDYEIMMIVKHRMKFVRRLYLRIWKF